MESITEQEDKDFQRTIRDFIDPDEIMEVDTEEKAMEYMKFLEAKMDEVLQANETLLRGEVAKRDALMDQQPRKVRRLFAKQKFSDRFKQSINSKQQ